MQVNLEAEICVENIVAEKTRFLCLLDRMLKSSVGQTVFPTNINVAFICTEGITGNCHCFYYCVRIAFEDNTIFKCSGFTLIRVADHIFLLALCHTYKSPLPPGREARAAASLQSRFLNCLDHLLSRHFG